MLEGFRVSPKTGLTWSGGACPSSFKNKPVCAFYFLILRNRDESQVPTHLPQEPSPPPTAKISIYRAAPRRPGEARACCAPRWNPPGQQVPPLGPGVVARACWAAAVAGPAEVGGAPRRWGVPRRSGFPRRWVSRGVGEAHGGGGPGGWWGFPRRGGGPGGGGS